MPKHNKSLKYKTDQRAFVLDRIAQEKQKPLDTLQPLVLECFGGFGMIFAHCYREVDARGATMDMDKEKVKMLARQRRDWIVARGDNAKLIGAGFCHWIPFDIIDADAFGSPWPVVNGWIQTDRMRAQRTWIVATDGLSYKFKQTGTARIKDANISAVTQKYGDEYMRSNYPDVAREILDLAIAGKGLEIAYWNFHTGGNQKVSHWTAALDVVSSAAAGK